jgi:hypothetical protein
VGYFGLTLFPLLKKAYSFLSSFGHLFSCEFLG